MGCKLQCTTCISIPLPANPLQDQSRISSLFPMARNLSIAAILISIFGLSLWSIEAAQPYNYTQDSQKAQQYYNQESQVTEPNQFKGSQAAKPYQFRNSKEAIEYYRKDSQAAKPYQFQNSEEAQEYDIHDSQAAEPYQFQNSKEGQEYNLHDSQAAKPYQFRNSKEAIEYYRKDSQAAAQEYYPTTTFRMHGRRRIAFGVGTVRRVFSHQSADQDVPTVALQLLTKSHACFSAKSAAQHVCVFPL